MIDTSVAFTEAMESPEVGIDLGKPLVLSTIQIDRRKLLTWDFTEQRTVLRRLCRSLMSVHREACVLPDLNFILQKVADAVEKVYTECRRVGAVSSKAIYEPPASSVISVRYGVQQLTAGYHTLGKLTNSLTLFLVKYQSEPISLLNYINMNRISKAERLLTQGFQRMKELLQLSFAIRFQSLGQAFVCAVRIRKFLREDKGNRSLELDGGLGNSQIPAKQLPPLQTPDDSFQQGLFTKTNEERPVTLWPVSPIGGVIAEASLNTSVSSVVDQIPKTIFTPAIALKPLKDIRI